MKKINGIFLVASTTLLLACNTPNNNSDNDNDITLNSSASVANSEILPINNTPIAETILEKLQNTNDSREIVYLISPDKDMIVYCYHSTRSECYIEGRHDNTIFKHDISHVENLNKGQITLNPIDRAETTPTTWGETTDSWTMVEMTTHVWIDGQRYTADELVMVDYKEGMGVR